MVGIHVKPQPKAKIGKRAEPEDLLVRSPGLVLVSLSSTSLGLRGVSMVDLDRMWLLMRVGIDSDVELQVKLGWFEFSLLGMR